MLTTIELYKNKKKYYFLWQIIRVKVVVVFLFLFLFICFINNVYSVAALASKF